MEGIHQNVSVYVHVNPFSVLLWGVQRHCSEWPTASLRASATVLTAVFRNPQEASGSQNKLAATLVVLSKSKGCNVFYASFSNGISADKW